MTTTINKEDRTISSDVMQSVTKFLPSEGFKLKDSMLNKEYTITSVKIYGDDKYKGFTVTMEDTDGNTITLGSNALKRSRYLANVVETPDKGFDDAKNIFLRSNVDSVWSSSIYMHSHLKMEKDNELVLPGKLKLRYAVLTEDASTGEPLINPFLYKGFRKVVKEYNKLDTYPTMDDFREELLKTEEDGRYSFLPKEMLKPELYKWVKKTAADFKHTLIFEQV